MGEACDLLLKCMGIRDGGPEWDDLASPQFFQEGQPELL